MNFLMGAILFFIIVYYLVNSDISKNNKSEEKEINEKSKENDEVENIIIELND